MSDYIEALRIVADFTENLTCGNGEYERGQLELLADLFPRPGIETGLRIEEIAEDVREIYRIAPA